MGYKKIFFLAAILCSLGFIIYSHSLGGAFQLDDYGVIIENPAIKNLTDLSNIWKFWPTRFITTFSFAINFRLERFNVFYFHLFNLAIHIGSAILVWWLMSLTFLTPEMKDKKIAESKRVIAFFAGLIFVSHPIQTEAVSYIVQRSTSLAAFLCLVSLCFYIKSRLLESGSALSNSWKSYYAASLITMIMAMFTKEMTIIFPLIILLYDFFFLRAGKAVYWRRLAPFFITMPIIPFTMLAAKSVNFSEMRLISEGPPGISPIHYLLTQLNVMVTYIRLLFIPLNQNVDYDYHIARALTEIPVLASLLFLIFILILALKILPKYRLASFGIFWFFLTLLPESSIIPIADVIFEHRLYLPMVGFSIFLASAVYYIFGRHSLKTLNMVMLIIIIFYSVLTYNRNFFWKDDLALWDDAVHKSPNKGRPYNNRGYAYMERHDLDSAIRDFNKAITLDPDSDAGYYYNLGNAYSVKGYFDKSISNYNKAIQMKPAYAAAYVNRGVTYSAKGELDKAIADYNQAIQIDSMFAMAYVHRSIAYFKKYEYVDSWKDMHQAELLGCDVPKSFREKLESMVKK